MLKNLSSFESLIDFVQSRKKALFVCSQTSTVIPFHRIESITVDDCQVVNLSQMPKSFRHDDQYLTVRGAVSWQEAQDYLAPFGKTLCCYPTDKSASILGGVATSCSGERSFAYGAFREQIHSIKFINFLGNEVQLNETTDLLESPLLNSFTAKEKEFLHQYQQNWQHYQGFKNAPFPRLEKETDLVVGSEGQLGVITEVKFKITEKNSEGIFGLMLPKWEENFEQHLKVVEAIQSHRELFSFCELIDHNSQKFVDAKLSLCPDNDLVALGFKLRDLDKASEVLLNDFSFLSPENIFEISQSKFNELRVAIPRAINESISRKNLLKKGTDAQVKIEKFFETLEYYNEARSIGVDYFLFGHLGDCHLHLNFLPNKEDEEKRVKVDEYLQQLYENLLVWQGSPFAEHGLGIIKLQYIRKFYSEIHKNMFKILKNKFDPHSQFFPMGYMSNSEI